MPCEVKQQPNSPHDFLPVNRLGHLTGPISMSLVFISGVCSLLAGLTSSKSKVCRHYDTIHPSPVDQCQQLHHLLHPIGARSLRSLGIAHGNLINVACHIVFPLWHVEPLLHPILHICVQWCGDVLANHPIPKPQLCVAYDPRSRPPWAFK